MTILKTRFIREDNPDIIGIGGDIITQTSLTAEMLMDISDFDGLNDIKENYLTTNKDLEYVPVDGVYAAHTCQMQPEFCITGTYLKNMDGRYQQHGMNFTAL